MAKFGIKPRLPVLSWGNPITRSLVFNMPLFERGGDKTINIYRKLSGAFGGANTPTWITGSIGPGVNFPSVVETTSSTIFANTTKILSGLNGFSILVVFRTAQDYGGTSGGALYCERAASGNDILKFEIAGDGGGGFQNLLIFTYRDDAATLSRVRTLGAGLVNDGLLHAGLLTRIGADARIFLDGKLYAVNGSFGTGNTLTDAITTEIGSDPQVTSGNYNGDIFQVVCWKRALTTIEAKYVSLNPWAMYKQPSGIYAPRAGITRIAN